MNRVFYPKAAGMTRQQIIEEIIETESEYGEPGRGNPWSKVQPPDPAKLTDQLMQKYVDDYEKLMGDTASGDMGDDGFNDATSDLLYRLAKRIKQ